jgi:hypothetical protein
MGLELMQQRGLVQLEVVAGNPARTMRHGGGGAPQQGRPQVARDYRQFQQHEAYRRFRQRGRPRL